MNSGLGSLIQFCNLITLSRDVPICNFLPKCLELILLVDFFIVSFYIVRKPQRKSMTSYLLMNINEFNAMAVSFQL